ncbi:MAG: hypothetical protein IM319_21025, partial [Microcystis sp. M113S1]|uniref:hypothetical protein n=1 Tax=Microcystis sp. M113S1 TaxID=2771104 RepID=UPI00258DCCB9
MLIVDILAAVKRTAIPHHATFLEWSLNGVDASRDAASLTEVLRFPPRPFCVSECPPATLNKSKKSHVPPYFLESFTRSRPNL